MDKLLKLLRENARLSDSQLAAMLGTTEEDVRKQIEQYEADGVIRGYRTLIDYEKLETETVMAIIELKVTPKPDLGFEYVADAIARLDEVESVYLTSGGFDLAVVIVGKSFKEIALFVSDRLAVIDSVISTATHFVLTKYKDNGIIFREYSDAEGRTAWLA